MHPFVAKYANTWPVTMLMCQYMNNHRQYQQRVEKGAPEAENPPVGLTENGSDNNNHGGGSLPGSPVPEA